MEQEGPVGKDKAGKAREERLIVIPSCDHMVDSESVSLYLSILEVNIKSISGAFRTIGGKWLLCIAFHFSAGATKETAALAHEGDVRQ